MQKETQLKLKAFLIVLVVSLILGGISVSGFEDYGVFVFMFIPFFMGFIPIIIIGQEREAKFIDGMLMGTYIFIAATIAMLIFAFEGMICIAMAAPIVFGLMAIGTGAGILLLKWRKAKSQKEGLMIICLLGVLSFGFDQTEKDFFLTPVETSVIVDANAEAVWENVVNFSSLPEPDNWIFKTGVAYPINAEMEGLGVGAIRSINFSTGPIVKSITAWEESKLLAFDVIAQPVPMDELNPFHDIHPPHLDNFLVAKKGQFVLTVLNENQTLLEGTTWYYLDIHPLPYWTAWSDFIIDRLHLMVLNHIKEQTENGA